MKQYSFKKIRTLSVGRRLKSKLHSLWMSFGFVIVIIVPIALLVGLVLKSMPLLENYPLSDLLFSSEWKPMSGKFGFFSFIVSSIWVTLVAMLIAMPICLLTAIHLTQYANKWVLKTMHPVIDILAGLPSVVFGVWGVLVVVPFISDYIAPFFGKTTSGYTILAGSIVLAIMIIPFILNVLISLFKTIPVELCEASLSLGATRWQTIKKVVLKKSFTGIVSAFGLGLSRAFGETIAVLMVVGNVVTIPKGIFQPGYPLPSLLANNYGEMLSIPMYDSALMFSALLLFVIVLFFNAVSRFIIIKSSKI